jgi:hypothetical protein
MPLQPQPQLQLLSSPARRETEGDALSNCRIETSGCCGQCDSTAETLVRVKYLESATGNGRISRWVTLLGMLVASPEKEGRALLKGHYPARKYRNLGRESKNLGVINSRTKGRGYGYG